MSTKTLQDKGFKMIRSEDYQSLLNDAMRWRKLVKLSGSLRDGSHETITIYQDDATLTSSIKIGNKWYHGQRSIESAIDGIPLPE